MTGFFLDGGGDCGTNIREVFRHLGSPGEARPNPRPDLWDGVLGPLAPAVTEIMDACDTEALRHQPATVFADQSKAFERISLDWIHRVLQGWRLPRWLLRGVARLLTGRAVCASGPRGRGPLRTLLRSLGMGGPPSPLLWAMGYDPIVEGLAVAMSIGVPTYVDDLAANVFGPRQAIGAELFLMAASHAAGLHMDCHTCEWLEAAAVTVRAGPYLPNFE